MYAEQMQKCTCCNEQKSESDFYNYKHEHRCKDCVSKIRKARYAKNPADNAAKKKMYRDKNPDIVKSTKLKQTYGITIKDYNAKLAEQNGVCAICKRPERQVWQGKVVKLAVDHNHKTGEIRGLLCMKCNRSLGLIEENISSMESMIEYTKKYLKLG